MVKPEVLRKLTYGLLIFLTFCLCAKEILTWYHKSTFNYVVPKLEELKITEGVLSISPRHKGLGGQLVLTLGDKQKLILTCQPPFSQGDKCNNRPFEYIDHKPRLTNKHVKAWWYPALGEHQDIVAGRVYQLDVEGWRYYDYRERTKFYNEHLRLHAEDRLFFAACYLILIVIFVRKINKEN